MYTIGQVSEMFHLPISTLRYYDKEGLFPEIQRTSGIRFRHLILVIILCFLGLWISVKRRIHR